MVWNPRALSDQYLARAAKAAARIKECRAKVPKSETYKRLHDEALAEFCVFNRLHGRTFLETPAKLLAELHTMKAIDQMRDPQIFDKPIFERARLMEIDLLARRIELLIPPN